MAYKLATYQADRAVLGFGNPLVVPTEALLSVKRMAVEAAYGRLLVWANSGYPPLEPDAVDDLRDPRLPDPLGSSQDAINAPDQSVEREKALAAWARELDEQRDRHKKRRGRFPGIATLFDMAVDPGAGRAQETPGSPHPPVDAGTAAAWAQELNAQRARHERRRGAFPKLLPVLGATIRPHAASAPDTPDSPQQSLNAADETAERESELTAWKHELDEQRDRHIRRRLAFPTLMPRPSA